MAAYAVVTILSVDIDIIRQFNKPVTEKFLDKIKHTEYLISITLLLLYVTGVYFVVWGSYADGGYIANQKLLFKLFVVGILTINGIFVGLLGKTIQVGDIIANYGLVKKASIMVVGVISSVSWVWACFVGIARSWNYSMSFNTIALFYLGSLVFALIVGFMATNWKKFSKTKDIF